ncbi:MAG: hypothetical protein EOM40_01990 [Clostridia bacterium]|nr:hypothetical protein [Clostridia bacterium]NCC43666.1 hypothetical protein [Clostridia bacterium]
MNRKIKYAIFAGIMCLMSAVNAMADTRASVIYEAGSSKVDVHLEEYMLKEGTEIPWENGQMVLPGAVLSKIPRICNDGEKCYVRTKVLFESEKGTDTALNEEDLLGISDEWIQIGEYFYYKKILEKKATVDFFQAVQIPTNWESGTDDDNKWRIEVKVEAIQAEFFTPDFSDEDPWHIGTGKYQIQKALEDEPGVMETDNTPVTFEIVNDTKGFSLDTDEFFRKMELFLPGKTQSGNIDVINRTDKERTVYMKSEVLEKNDFIEKMELTVQIKDQDKINILYQGSMDAEKMSEYQSIGSIDAQSTGKLEMLLTLPEDADNRYSAKQGKVKLIFTTDQQMEEQKKTNQRNQKTGKSENVKTGDTQNIWIWVVAGIGVPIACFIPWISRKIRKKRDAIW